MSVGYQKSECHIENNITNAQSAGLRSLVAAESALQYP